MLRTFFALALALSCAGGWTQAATVSPGTAVAFGFDAAGLGELTFSRLGFNCNPAGSCADPIAAGSSWEVGFGTSPGGTDLGTRSFDAPFQTDAASTPFSPDLVVPASLDAFFLTFFYVDDTFEVLAANLSDGFGPLTTGTLVGEIAVPVPAAAWLLLGALGVLGLRRAKG